MPGSSTGLARSTSGSPSSCGSASTSSASRSDGTRSRRPAGQRSWGSVIRFSTALVEHGISPVVTLFGARAGRTEAVLPTGRPVGRDVRGLRVRGGEPLPVGQRGPSGTSRTSALAPPDDAADYVTQLLNPAYAAIHRANRGRARRRRRHRPARERPAASRPCVDPRHGRAGAKLDAYAHHPYPRARSRRRGPAAASMRDDHDGDARAAAAEVRAPSAAADLADRVRLPDEPARPRSRRLPRAPGALHRARRPPRLRRRTSTCSSSFSSGTSPRSGAGRAGYIAVGGERPSSHTVLRSFLSCRFPASAFGRCCGGRYGRATGGGATCSSSSETAAGDPLAGSERRTRTDS